MDPIDESKFIPHVDYLERELLFHSQYEKEIDWKVYQSQRSKRLEVERWVESLINAALNISTSFRAADHAAEILKGFQNSVHKKAHRLLSRWAF